VHTTAVKKPPEPQGYEMYGPDPHLKDNPFAGFKGGA